MAANVERAKFVKMQRELRGWTQEHLATVTDVDARTIQRVESSGSANPETLMAIAQAFDMKVEQLTSPETFRDETSTQKRIHLLPRLVSGFELTYLVTNVDQLQFEHDDDSDPRSVDAMRDVLNAFKQDVVRLHDAGPAERARIEEELTQEFMGIEKWGYYIFGIRRVIPKIEGEQQSLISLATFYMSHARSPRVVKDKQLMVVPALLTEIMR